jgi:SAM-dependent methyltransferase
MPFERIDCPICLTDDTTELLQARDINFFGPGEFHVVRCRHCGLVYPNPRPTPAGMAQYYPPHYWTPPPATDVPPYLDAGIRRSLAILCRDYPGRRILDVGCAVGRMPAFLRTLGFDAVGLEPYELPCRLGRDRYGIEIIHATLQDADLEDESFDALTFFDVLEHMDDPVGDLKRARALLKPGGAVFVKVPNIAAMQARLFGRWWYWLDVPRHLWHFSPRSLRRALEVAGFADVRCRAIPEWEGAMVFETSLVYWLRGVLLARKGIAVQPSGSQTVGEVLEGKVYPGVPSAGKRAFRWLVRNVVYLPFAIENLVGRSVELLAIARR